MPKLTQISLIISTILLTACGGSDSSTPEVDDQLPVETDFSHQVIGTVVDLGVVAGAEACIDLNMNLTCDDSEPTSTTDQDGGFQIDWESATESPAFNLLATWVPVAPQSTSKWQPRRINNPDGSVTLQSLQENNGFINNLTDMQVQAYQRLAEDDDLSEAQRIIAMAEFKRLLVETYGLTGENPIRLDAATASSEQFIQTYQVHQYLAAQVDAIEEPMSTLEAVVAVERVLAATLSQINMLIEQSGQSASEYLASAPAALTTVVEQQVIALGFKEQPIDDSLMTATDWQVINEGILSSESGNHALSFTLNPNDLVYLNYGAIDESIVGFEINDMVTIIETSPDVDEGIIPMSCWNVDKAQWVSSEDAEAVEPSYSGNTLTTVYEGTSTEIYMQVTKLDTQTDAWQSLIGATNSAFKLADITWPRTMYRLNVEMEDDVICRPTNENDQFTWDHPVASPDNLDTRLIVKTFFNYDFEADDFSVDGNEFTISEQDTYRWQLVDTPNGQKAIEIVNSDENVPSIFIDADYYLWDENVIIEVELESKIQINQDSYAMLIFEQSMDEVLYDHFMGLKTEN